MAYGLTPKQAECYAALAAWFRVHGRQPSCEELRRQLNTSSRSSVAYLLCQLEERGWIRRRVRGKIELLVETSAPPAYDFEITEKGLSYIAQCRGAAS